MQILDQFLVALRTSSVASMRALILLCLCALSALLQRKISLGGLVTDQSGTLYAHCSEPRPTQRRGLSIMGPMASIVGATTRHYLRKSSSSTGRSFKEPYYSPLQSHMRESCADQGGLSWAQT